MDIKKHDIKIVVDANTNRSERYLIIDAFGGSDNFLMEISEQRASVDGLLITVEFIGLSIVSGVLYDLVKAGINVLLKSPKTSRPVTVVVRDHERTIVIQKDIYVIRENDKEITFNNIDAIFEKLKK